MHELLTDHVADESLLLHLGLLERLNLSKLIRCRGTFVFEGFLLSLDLVFESLCPSFCLLGFEFSFGLSCCSLCIGFGLSLGIGFGLSHGFSRELLASEFLYSLAPKATLNIFSGYSRSFFCSSLGFGFFCLGFSICLCLSLSSLLS